MNKVRNFIVSAPRIAGVKDHEQFSYIAGKVYDADVDKITDLFDRNPDWSISDRVRFLFLWCFSEPHDDKLGELLYGLAVFAAWSIDVNNGRAEKTDEYLAEEIRLRESLKSYPEVSGIMSVEDAAALMGWAPT